MSQASAAVRDNEAVELQEKIAALGPWFHNLRLKGVETAPQHFLGDYPRVKYERFSHVIPADLTGKTVLDIGCNAGFYSMEMKRRGATRVVGIDTEPLYLRQAQFSAEVTSLEIEFREMSVWDVARLGERFDLVIFMGVLYHLRHPLLALDLIYEHVAGDLLLFQSMQRGSAEVMELEDDYDFWDTAMFDEPEYPRLHFIEKSYCSDMTNWWVPNRACAEAMLRSAGFRIEEHPEEEVYLCRRDERGEGASAVYPARG
jgi:tRNA (mo5U34)-methyltransferase